MVHLLHEGDHVAGFAAAEAVEGADLRAHVEGRGALVVERAQALPGADAGGLQRHIPVNDFLDVGAVADFFDVFTFNQAGHTPQSSDRGKMANAAVPLPAVDPAPADATASTGAGCRGAGRASRIAGGRARAV